MMHCSNKRMSHQKEIDKLKKTYLATKNSYGAGVWFSEKKNRLIKYSCNSKSLRQALNRITRRKMNRSIGEDEGSIPVGHYRKMTDYWWDLL